MTETFSTSSDVDYFPLDLENAGTSGTVTIIPTGVVQVSATLFRRPRQRSMGRHYHRLRATGGFRLAERHPRLRREPE